MAELLTKISNDLKFPNAIDFIDCSYITNYNKNKYIWKI